MLRHALRGSGYFRQTRYAEKIASFFDRDEPYDDLREDALFAYALAFAQEGTRVYIARCQQCHDQNSDAHAPLPAALATKPWQDILKALETGLMRAQGAQLTPEERIAVARYLGKAGPVEVPTMTGQCPANQKPTAGPAVWNGWSPDERNTRFQPASAAGITAEQLPKLQLKWAFGFDGDVTAFSPPKIFLNCET